MTTRNTSINMTLKQEMTAKGLLGKAQFLAHKEDENLQTPGRATFTTGSLNFPQYLLSGVTEESLPELVDVLRKARKEVIAVLMHERSKHSK